MWIHFQLHHQSGTDDPRDGEQTSEGLPLGCIGFERSAVRRARSAFSGCPALSLFWLVFGSRPQVPTVVFFQVFRIVFSSFSHPSLILSSPFPHLFLIFFVCDASRSTWSPPVTSSPPPKRCTLSSGAKFISRNTWLCLWPPAPFLSELCEKNFLTVYSYISFLRRQNECNILLYKGNVLL